MTTKSQQAAADVVSLLKARNSLLWIVTSEEARVEAHLFEAASAARMTPRTWDVAAGVADAKGVPAINSDQSPIGGPDPGATFTEIFNRGNAPAIGLTAERGLWIMRDLPVWLQGQPMAATLRQLRNLARVLPTQPLTSAQAIVVLSPNGDVPPELAPHATVIEWPMPDREEIAEILDAAIAALPEELRAVAAPNGSRDAAITAAVGLTGEEASKAFRRSLVQSRTVDPAMVAGEKKRVIAREGVLEWVDPLPGGLDAVGGLDQIKTWTLARKLAYSAKARAYGLPAPKGMLLVGVQGCGKTLTAKATATAFDCPLIRVDLGALKSKFVGESEGNLRKALRVIESVGRCVVWIDEIEKALAGATQGAADGGVSADALGTILSWMQDRTTEAFVIATANSVEALPPELLRKGRFDELFFVDLPTRGERIEILRAALKANGREPEVLGHSTQLALVAEVTNSFAGSEIAAIVPEAMFAAFADGEREITTADLVKAARNTVPLSQTSAEKIDALRKWAKGRARPATSSTQADQAAPRVMQLDM